MLNRIILLAVRVSIFGLFLVGSGLSGPWSYASRLMSLRSAAWLTVSLVAVRLVAHGRRGLLVLPVVLSVAVFTTQDTGIHALLLVCLLWTAVGVSPPRARRGDQAVALGCGSLWLFALASQASPSPVLALEFFLASVAERAGWPKATHAMPGLVSSGAPLIAGALVALFWTLRQYRVVLALASVAVLSAWAGAVAWSFASADLPRNLELAVTGCARLSAVIAAVATCAVPFLAEVKTAGERTEELAARKGRLGGVAACAVLAAIGVLGGRHLWPEPVSTPTEGLRVTFYTEGGLDWKVPEYGRFGAFSSGMFGLLPHGLQQIGCAVAWIGPNDDLALSLADTDIFVVISCDEIWSVEREGVVESFVRNGGGLLALGDHTDVFGLMGGMNSLLARYGIAYEFDSAYPLSGRGIGSQLHSRLGDVSWGRPTGASPSVSVGASLAVNQPAWPLTWSHWAFRDIGNRSNVPGSFLGNYSLDAREQVGMIPVAAAAEHGDGVVVAFGDTTAFQNAAMSRSLAYDVAPLLAWMEAGQGARRRDQHWVSLTLLATGLLVLLSLVRVNVEWLWVSLTLGLAAPWYGHHIPSTQATSRSPKAGYEALVATDYFQRFGHHDADGSNLGPMITAFRRSGFWPRYIENFGSAEDLSRASVIALIAPRVDLPSQHVENLCSAMEGGALVLIAASGPEAAGADSLLRKLGVSVTRNLLPQVRRSEEVSFMRPYELIVEPGIVHEPLVVVGGAIAIVYVPRGDGGAIVFGDTAFFSSRNIESSSGHHEGAQALISTLLARFGGGDEERFGQVRD